MPCQPNDPCKARKSAADGHVRALFDHFLAGGIGGTSDPRATARFKTLRLQESRVRSPEGAAERSPGISSPLPPAPQGAIGCSPGQVTRNAWRRPGFAPTPSIQPRRGGRGCAPCVYWRSRGHKSGSRSCRANKRLLPRAVTTALLFRIWRNGRAHRAS